LRDDSALATDIYRSMVREILDDYAQRRWPLIPVLQETQRRIGYIPPQCVQLISEALGPSPGEIQGVISFYEQLREMPRGRTVIRTCRGTACHVRGGAEVVARLRDILQIGEGETTRDLAYSLETVACVGACGLAPNVLVDDEVHGRMTPRKVEQLLQDREEEDPW